MIEYYTRQKTQITTPELEDKMWSRSEMRFSHFEITKLTLENDSRIKNQNVVGNISPKISNLK